MELDQIKENLRTTSPGWLVSTHWSVVILAGGNASPQAASALEKLCRSYWQPLYSYIRRQGYNPADAQDLTQGFFFRLLRMESLGQVSQEKGKFRTFLLASLKHFLSDERDHACAEKRGGGQAVLSIDAAEAEEHYLHVPDQGLAPEKLYDHRWALTVLESALRRLRHDSERSGKGELFQHLSAFLSTEGSKSDYEALGSKLGMAPGAVSVAVHRLRQRYRECIRLELAHTVSNPNELDDEMHYLFSVLSA